MKYPYSTNSKPVMGREAQALLEAIENGGSRTNATAQATINSILATLKVTPAKDGRPKREISRR